MPTGSWSASTSPVRSPSPDRSESGRTYYGTTSLDQRSRSPSPVSTTGSGRHQQNPHHYHQQQHHHHHHNGGGGGGASASSSTAAGPTSSRQLQHQQTSAAPSSSSSMSHHHPHHHHQSSLGMQPQLSLSSGGGHAMSVSAMMTGAASASAAATSMTMPPPSVLVNSSYPVLAVAGCNRRRLPATPNKPSSLQLRPPHHSASINFPKLNASPTRGAPAALPKPPTASSTAAAVARQSMAMTAMPPLSFEQAMSIGRSGRLLPSPVRNGYAAATSSSSSKQQQQPSSATAVRRQKSGGGACGSGRVSSRHSDSDEDDWC